MASKNMPLSARLKRVAQNPGLIIDRVYRALRGGDAPSLTYERDTARGIVHRLAAFAPELNLMPLGGMVEEEDLDARELGGLFAHHGSDKSTKHDYYRLYAHLLQGKRHAAAKILEIGLGTNNTDVPSNMGSDGKPGASLRAFRDWGKLFEVYGADVDARVLFSEERIETYFVDQTNRDSLKGLADRFEPQSFDLIIDDGLHQPLANFNTIEALAGLLKSDGVLVVEDIVEKYSEPWRAAMPVLNTRFDATLLQCKREIVCLIRPKA